MYILAKENTRFLLSILKFHGMFFFSALKNHILMDNNVFFRSWHIAAEYSFVIKIKLRT
jgi:hypothetical protein